MYVTSIMGVTIGDTYTVISRNNELPLNYVGSVHLIGTVSSTTTNPHNVKIGLKSHKYNEQFHNLDGHVATGYGWWVPLPLLLDTTYFKLVSKITGFKVNKDYIFKGKNLKGMSCKPLHTVSPSEVWVEFENNIGGFCCDGHGKRGHCIPISHDILTKQQTKG